MLLARVAKIERQWAGEGDEKQKFIPFIAYPRSRFIMYLTDAMEAAQGDRFIDIGCGPGSKVMLASEGFNLDGFGIDRVPSMVEAARSHGVKADVADALEYDSYGEFDILFMNRPCHDMLQVQLEQRVMAQMARGSILIMVNSATRPPAGEFLPLALEWDETSQVVQKL